MRLLTLATTTADGRPLAAPVDGFFYRGEFWFGSSPRSLLMRHLVARPAVSGTHSVGEQLAVSVHGSARVVDLSDPVHRGFRAVAVEQYGTEWEDWGTDAVYARIEADRLFTFWMEGPA
jgi:hypothetical protein